MRGSPSPRGDRSMKTRRSGPLASGGITTGTGTALSVDNSGMLTNFENEDASRGDWDVEPPTPPDGSAPRRLLFLGDVTGNTGTSSFNVIVSYDFKGFFRPIDNLPVVNVVKAGQAIPVKFSLGGNMGLGIMASGYPRSVVMACNSGTLQDTIEETVTAGGE